MQQLNQSYYTKRRFVYKLLEVIFVHMRLEGSHCKGLCVQYRSRQIAHMIRALCPNRSYM